MIDNVFKKIYKMLNEKKWAITYPVLYMKNGEFIIEYGIAFEYVKDDRKIPYYHYIDNAVGCYYVRIKGDSIEELLNKVIESIIRIDCIINIQNDKKNMDELFGLKIVSIEKDKYYGYIIKLEDGSVWLSWDLREFSEIIGGDKDDR